MFLAKKLLYLISKHQEGAQNVLKEINHKIFLPSQQFCNVIEHHTGSLLLTYIGMTKNYNQIRFCHPRASYILTSQFPFQKMLDNQKLQFSRHYKLHSYKKILIYSLYGNQLASRFAIFLLNLGIKDFQILDGGIINDPAILKNSWDENLQSPEKIQLNQNEIEIQKGIIFSAKEIKQLQNNQRVQLLDVRSYPEHIGKISGYPNIDKKGTLKNAIYACNIQQYKSSTMKKGDFNKILKKWDQRNIDRSKKLIFFCGRGYRAAQAFMYALDSGITNIGMFSGIIEWLENGYELQKRELSNDDDDDQ